MTTYQKFKKMNIDHSVIGMDQSDSNTNYFCTPKGAKIIGNAGVDGIHYCFIEGFEDMVFVVSPEGVPGEYVHPIAKDFEELLSLLLACGSMDAIEQTYMWDEELFEQYIMDNQPGTKQREILEVLRAEFQIAPLEHPYTYIKELQHSFDYTKLEYSEEYYELVPEVKAPEAVVPEWKVTYEGGFYPKRGRAGKELRVDKEFAWENGNWHIPAVYLCTKGLVADFCVEVELERVKAFINKWNLFIEDDRERSNAEYEQIEEEHPLNMEFHSKVLVNENELFQKHGCAIYWIPEECMPDDLETETEAKGILEHYGYDLRKAWAVHRVAYPWVEKKPRTVKTLNIQLEREKVKIPCVPFVAPKVGESHIILNPITGVEHTLTVQAYEERKMDPKHFPDDSMEWPTNYAIMTYTLFPEFDDFMLQDANQGDSPRRKQSSPHGPVASSVGIIGLRPKVDDAETYLHPDGTVAKLRVCCSGMYFEKPETIEWKFTFREKRVPDIKVELV